MASAITETDTYTATITAPDAGDAITAASVRTMGQGLTNRSLHHENRIDDLETAMTAAEADVATLQAAVIARMTPSATVLADAGTITLALSSSYYDTTSWAVSSNEVTVPSAGVYRYVVNMVVNVGSSADPDACIIYVRVNGAIVSAFVGVRFSTGTGDYFTISGEDFVVISTPASQKFTLTNESGTTLTSEDYGGSNSLYQRFTVERIGAA
jgi:hypothetical protein